MQKKNRLSRIVGLGSMATALGVPLAFADATSTATALSTGVTNYLDTLVDISLAFITNDSFVTAMIIAMFVFGVLYWLKRKVL